MIKHLRKFEHATEERRASSVDPCRQVTHLVSYGSPPCTIGAARILMDLLSFTGRAPSIGKSQSSCSCVTRTNTKLNWNPALPSIRKNAKDTIAMYQK
jgi:hypothetical protein